MVVKASRSNSWLYIELASKAAARSVNFETAALLVAHDIVMSYLMSDYVTLTMN